MTKLASSTCRAPLRQQAGFITLAISMVVLLAATLTAFGMVRTTLIEQRITNNDTRAKEARHAAEAALEYGIAWYTSNNPSWSTSGSVEIASPSSAAPTLTGNNGEQFTATVGYQRDPSQPNYVRVTASVVAASAANISASVQQYIYNNSLLANPTSLGPPMIIDGCFSGALGNPDIYPSGYGSGGPFGSAISTSQPSTVDGSDCIQLGHLNVHGGATENDAFSGDLWNQLFSVSRTEMKAIADQEVANGVADEDRTVVWVTSTANYHTSWGSASKPVILVFDAVANCPTINGNPTIYGVVFMDSACDSANGWGGTDVYGTVAVNGDVSDLNANTTISDWSLTGGDTGHLKSGIAPRIPGSWKDF
ncbi:pilus assembly PilX family protein [Marinobacterium arenosum]|uniref:pilus assembly PilX family protein n=1 Tax=Marinobacterium arenosum TaxID=2862496 RepID=UPI001C94DAA1|nr:PilX N-terminal domain-containing pilus assembly protein [Marinobacterium arenosum]MBY4675838.1 hypothetical protein [Marinobacterium arenosum]